MKNRNKLLLGISFIAVSVLMSALLNKTNPLFSVVLFSFGIAVLAFLIPGFFDFKYKAIVSASGSLGVFVFLLLFLKPGPSINPITPTATRPQDTLPAKSAPDTARHDGTQVEVHGNQTTVIVEPKGPVNINQTDADKSSSE